MPIILPIKFWRFSFHHHHHNHQVFVLSKTILWYLALSQITVSLANGHPRTAGGLSTLLSTCLKCQCCFWKTALHSILQWNAMQCLWFSVDWYCDDCNGYEGDDWGRVRRWWVLSVAMCQAGMPAWGAQHTAHCTNNTQYTLTDFRSCRYRLMCRFLSWDIGTNVWNLHSGCTIAQLHTGCCSVRWPQALRLSRPRTAGHPRALVSLSSMLSSLSSSLLSLLSTLSCDQHHHLQDPQNCSDTETSILV